MVLMLGSFADSELSCRIDLQADIGDRETAFEGDAVGSVDDAPLGSVQGREPILQTVPDGDVHSFVLQRLSAVWVAGACVASGRIVVEPGFG